MAYPTGLKIFIDGVDCTYYIFGSNTFDPSVTRDTFRDLDITPYLRKPISPMKMTDRNYKGNAGVQDVHTIEITAQDGNGRVEARVEVR
jgi:hypothetical protein